MLELLLGVAEGFGKSNGPRQERPFVGNPGPHAKTLRLLAQGLRTPNQDWGARAVQASIASAAGQIRLFERGAIRIR